ncbi:MAG: hypothetical protein WBQ25_00800 [Nitrososphaeraceae archaeon]
MYRSIILSQREFVSQTVEQRLANQKHVLALAFLSVIDSCRKDPVKFNILYHNLSTAAIAVKRPAEFDHVDQYNYGLPTSGQLCCQHENSNDSAYWRFLVDEAEKFFNDRLNELEQMCINRLTDVFTSVFIPSQSTKNSDLDSEVATSTQLYENKNVQSATRIG